MSIPNEALQKLLQEIEQSAAASQQQISVVKAQIAAKQREGRMLQLTSSEVAALPEGTKAYEGVGKMFMTSPAVELRRRLEKESGQVKDDIDGLAKKLHYLETTDKNSREHIDQLLNAGVR